MSSKTLHNCELCCNKVSNNFLVICPFCSVEICEECFQYSITMELKNPICIYCKNNFSLEFVLENNVTKWCKETFIPYFENLCLEKERSYLIDTMPKYKKMVRIRELNKEIKGIISDKSLEKKVIKEFKELSNFDEHNKSYLSQKAILAEIRNDANFIKLFNSKLNEKNDKKKKLNDELISIQGFSNEKKTLEKKTVYICNCPNEKCRGYITDNYNCEICKLEICKLCMVEKNENHSCKRDDIESAELIRNSSKPCPKCYVPIFKISGCNQMFCTNCHVVFDWVTLKIDKGNVHNAHYFDWMVNQTNTNVNLDEIACGDIVEIYRNLHFKLSKKINNNWQYYNTVQKIRHIFDVNRIINGEIIENIREKSIKNKFEEYRIQYLDNKISEKLWKSRIAKDTINNEKNKSLIEVFEMYVTVTSDLIRQLAFEKITIDELLKSYEKFYDYFDKSIDNILQIFGGNLTGRQCVVHHQANIK